MQQAVSNDSMRHEDLDKNQCRDAAYYSINEWGGRLTFAKTKHALLLMLFRDKSSVRRVTFAPRPTLPEGEG